MKILLVDDEELQLTRLVESVKKVLPTDEVFSFTNPLEALKHSEKNQIDIAFLDCIRFFAGKSKPRRHELSDVFLQLRISERSGRGVTRVVDTYSKEAFDIESDFIKVTIPFSSERYLGAPSEQKSEQKSEQVYTGKASRVKEAIVSEMRNNASITTAQLMSILGLGKTIIQKYIRELTADGIIIHHGTKRGSYWEVLK